MTHLRGLLLAALVSSGLAIYHDYQIITAVMSQIADTGLEDSFITSLNEWRWLHITTFIIILYVALVPWSKPE